MPIVEDNLWGAAGRGDVERLRYHLDGGVGIESRGQAGINALGYAACMGRSPAVEFLLSRGANPSGIGYEDASPLGLAGYCGDVNCIRLLLDAGADIDFGHLSNGEGPLHLAAVKGRTDAVKYLLSRGANPSARASVGGGSDFIPGGKLSGETPLHHAAVGGVTEIMLALIEAGADRSARTEDNETPADLARRIDRNPDYQCLLEESGTLQESTQTQFDQSL